jgi:hypothetical protein
MHDFCKRIVADSEQHQISALNDGERIGKFDTRQQRFSPDSGEIRNSMCSNNRMAGTTKCSSQHRSGSPGADDTHI